MLTTPSTFLLVLINSSTNQNNILVVKLFSRLIADAIGRHDN